MTTASEFLVSVTRDTQEGAIRKQTAAAGALHVHTQQVLCVCVPTELHPHRPSGQTMLSACPVRPSHCHASGTQSTQSFPSGRRGGLAVWIHDWCQSRAKWRRNRTHSAQLGDVNERHTHKETCALGVALLRRKQDWTSEKISLMSRSGIKKAGASCWKCAWLFVWTI